MSDDAPVTWPRALFGLIEYGGGPPGRLALCVRHRGQHVYYLDGCHALPPHRRSRRPRRCGTADRTPDVVVIDPDAWTIKVVGSVLDRLLKQSTEDL